MKEGITNKYNKCLNLFKRSYRVKKCTNSYTHAYIHIHTHTHTHTHRYIMSLGEIYKVLMENACNFFLQRKEKTNILVKKKKIKDYLDKRNEENSMTIYIYILN